MENNTSKLERFCVGTMIALLCFFAVTIAVRFFSRQILVERLHWDNVITKIIWFDNSEAGEVDNKNANDEGGGASIDIDWDDLYPFTESDTASLEERQLEIRRNNFIASKMLKVRNVVNSIEDRISAYAEDLLIGYDFEVAAAKKYNKFLGLDRIVNFSNDTDIIYLDNGYLTYVEPAVNEEDINYISSNVANFSKYLSEQGIDFCYVNAGSKVCPYDKQLAYTIAENTNENADSLLKALAEKNVHYLDLREKMIEEDMDWYNAYYITDHHWKTETGLWAAGQLGIYLNEEFYYKFNIDLFEPSKYDMITTEDFWIGAQGRTATFDNVELESYTKIIPKYDTNFHVEVPEKQVSKDGSYEDTLFDNSIYNQISSYSKADHMSKPSAYDCVTWTNQGLGIIRNKNSNSNMGKKILFIQDSFSWYSTTFLACDIDAIDIIHPSAFTGSIRNYVQETKPDMVILMLCERKINTFDEHGHSSVFDLK